MASPDTLIDNPGVEQNQRSLAIAGIGATCLGAGLYVWRDRPLSDRLQNASLLPFVRDIAQNMYEPFTGLTVGGTAIDAFVHEGTEASSKDGSMIVSNGFDKKLIRKNNTICDLDIYVYKTNDDGQMERASDKEQDDIQKKLREGVEGLASELALPAPVVSVCSFDTKTYPWYSSTIIDEFSSLFLAQGFVYQPLPETSMKPFRLILDDSTTLKVLHPWEQYWRSRVRYSSGEKPKDEEKLAKQLDRLRTNEGFSEQEDAPLASAYSSFYKDMLEQNQFRTAFNSILHGDRRPLSKDLAKLAAARHIMTLGQKFEFIQATVQANPWFFNRFGSTR
jgi:hypothetical protein